jgi:hypothetical protein
VETQAVPKLGKPSLIHRMFAFTVLFAAWVAIDRLADHYGFLGVHESIRRSVLIGAVWATIMVTLTPALAGAVRSIAVSLGRGSRS